MTVPIPWLVASYDTHRENIGYVLIPKPQGRDRESVRLKGWQKTKSDWDRNDCGPLHDIRIIMFIQRKHIYYYIQWYTYLKLKLSKYFIPTKI